MNKTEAIKDFLTKQNNASPVAKYYNKDMEVKLDVIVGKLVRAGIGNHVFSNDKETWESYRIPWNAKDNPTYTDSLQTFSLNNYTQAIGMTGWNWSEQRSCWVGFDFDSIINHKGGLSNEELNIIFNSLLDIPWVTIYTSTSGLGYHIYVFIENSPVITNSTDHAAFARAILSKLDDLCPFKLTEKVDICGGNLWVWKRGRDTGFALLKSGVKLDGNKIYNWADFLVVPEPGKLFGLQGGRHCLGAIRRKWE